MLVDCQVLRQLHAGPEDGHLAVGPNQVQLRDQNRRAAKRGARQGQPELVRIRLVQRREVHTGTQLSWRQDTVYVRQSQQDTTRDHTVDGLGHKVSILGKDGKGHRATRLGGQLDRTVLVSDQLLPLPDHPGTGHTLGVLVADLKMQRVGVLDLNELKKSLYGLNQAPRNFYYHAAGIFKDIGFKQSQSDECLFTYDGPEGQVILGLYVDDMFYACSNDKTMEWFRKQLSDRFKITHFDNPDQFVGMDIEWKRNRATLCMERHIQGALKRYDITPDPKITMPMNPDLKTAAYDGVATKEEVSAYRSICGSLLFIAGCARPDICFALSVCTQYLLNPSSAHMDMALRILHYLGNTPKKGLEYVRQVGVPMTFFGMVDASYGSITEAARSQTGFVLISTAGIVLYKSTVQKTVATSSSSAEMRACFHCCREMLGMRALFREIALAFTHKVHYSGLANILLVDNSTTVQLCRVPKQSEKSRHWLMAFQWIRYYQELGHLRVAWVAGTDNLADLLTKPVVRTIWDKLSNFFYYSKWIGSYMIDMVRRQLDVDLRTWKPTHDEYDLGSLATSNAC